MQQGHARNENVVVPNLESSLPLIVKEELSLFHPVAVLLFQRVLKVELCVEKQNNFRAEHELRNGSGTQLPLNC